jgi:chloramphenicol 3-O phosphotransferase
MLIVLYGTSCSGKTSLAEAMQAMHREPLLLIEADRFWPTIAEGRVAKDDADFRSRIVVAMHEAAAAFGRSGVDTIVDGSMPGEPDLRDRCLEILRELAPTKLVAVRCSVDVLRAREALRPDRVKGWAEEQSRTLYDGLDFDFTVDTTTKPADDCARDLLQTLFPS